MSRYLIHIEDTARDNQHYRLAFFTAQHSQPVLMNLKPGEEIGKECNESDAPAIMHGQVQSDPRAISR